MVQSGSGPVQCNHTPSGRAVAPTSQNSLVQIPFYPECFFLWFTCNLDCEQSLFVFGIVECMILISRAMRNKDPSLRRKYNDCNQAMRLLWRGSAGSSGFVYERIAVSFSYQACTHVSCGSQLCCLCSTISKKNNDCCQSTCNCFSFIIAPQVVFTLYFQAKLVPFIHGTTLIVPCQRLNALGINMLPVVAGWLYYYVNVCLDFHPCLEMQPDQE